MQKQKKLKTGNANSLPPFSLLPPSLNVESSMLKVECFPPVPAPIDLGQEGGRWPDVMPNPSIPANQLENSNSGGRKWPPVAAGVLATSVPPAFPVLIFPFQFSAPGFDRWVDSVKSFAGKETVKFMGGARVPASRYGSCDGQLLPLGGEGRDEGALRQSEVYVARSGRKNLTGKETVKFLVLYQALATIDSQPGKETGKIGKR